MADELPTSVSPGKPVPTSIEPAPSSHVGLRWAIRLTGVFLMLGATVYLAMVAYKLVFGTLSYHRPTDAIPVLVVSLFAFALGYCVFRVGLNMLRSVDSAAITSFSFVFALVNTSILMRFLPASSLFHRHLPLMLLLVLVYFGLTYLILKRILLFLLFPRKSG